MRFEPYGSFLAPRTVLVPSPYPSSHPSTVGNIRPVGQRGVCWSGLRWVVL